MMNNEPMRTSITRGLAVLGLLCTIAASPTGTAAMTEPEAESSTSMDDCAESSISIQVDTLTGDAYVVDPNGSVLIDDDLTVYFGGQSRVLLDLEFTSDEWEVSITADGSVIHTMETTGGRLRYFLRDSYTEYVISATEAQSGASSMMNLAPVPPADIIIVPDSDCVPD